MIRFCDLREADIAGGRFAFFDTVVGRFFECSGQQAWDTFKDFEIDYRGEYRDGLLRFEKLCPEWAFSEPNEEETPQ